ncbi:tetratricopeptide repeat protein [Poseidonibacter ostreae]|jgi:lipopolysaccharide biosynthesis regulator YciM|uniref:Tetratricopeptide repeat protein n=1 Tax=Poseidonibacter ostreae TaxID=2654171 RepID=A0A6L4WNW7_9BACT|nr:tetratricopeptide repeat protein [Poseidonibacter ostreae]KAB7884375.1 tetratricopeptide repeat protein [Poseidonibacter ostreae]KAB7885296.1 tetratricopeptide repeat protein [Poseidonibacter ostreae]KAB7891732.1 tetratricopeptide repeat protein [Poseidonibacter ostreae]
MTNKVDDKYKIMIASAWEKYNKKDFVGAKKICIQINNDFPDKLGANYLLGIIYLDEDKFIDSSKELKIALTKDYEKNAGGFINYTLGRNYGKQTYIGNENPLYDKDLSRKYFEQALEYEKYPENTITELHYIYQNNYKIIQLFKDAIKKFPENLDFVITLSDIYLKIGEVDNQKKVLLAVKNKFNSTHLLYKLSKIELSIKNFEKSRELINQAKGINVNPKSEFALQLELANIYYSEGNINKAKEIFFDNFNKEKNTDNFWFGLIGVLMCVDNKDYDDFTILLSKMEITKQFIIDDWFGDMPIYFDSSICVGIYLLENEKDVIKKLNVLKKRQTDKDILGKIELLKYSLYKNIGEETLCLNTIKKSIKYLNTYHYDFLFIELREAYHSVFYNLIESDKSIDDLIIDLSAILKEEYSFRKVFLSSLEFIIQELHNQKEYELIIELYENFSTEEVDKLDIWFEVAYAFNKLEKVDKAKYAYHKNLRIKGESSALLNNLANLYEKEDKFDEAIDMYQKALSLESDDTLIKTNLENTLDKQKKMINQTHKKDALNKIFLNAVELLKSENFFTLESLYIFLLNCRKEDDFDNWNLPIQNEMFPILMSTNEKKAMELKNNWISKNYIIKVEETDEYDIPYFQINPYIDREVTILRDMVSEINLPQEWLTGLNNISIFQLNELNYTETSKRIIKINKKYRPLISRDYNELIFNYLVGNKKSTIILSGSFVELILTYYCERKKIKKVEYKNTSGKIIKKNLYDCVLFDLISFIDDKKYFGNDFFPLTNLSRVYRNFIHPGVELKNHLDKTKSDLCFISSIEILRKII